MEVTETMSTIIVLPVFFGFSTWIIKLFLDAKKARLKSQLHHKLIEKFENVKELSEFLQSKSGSGFLRSLTIEGITPKDRIMDAVSRGVIAACLGVAVLAVGMLFVEEWRYVVSAGILIVALGVGYMVSAAVSFRLSKNWGLLSEENDS